MNKYEVQQLIGQGSQANIYKAFCVKTKQLVAIKHYTGIDFYETEDVQQIVDEGKLLLALKHPNILKCYDLVKKPNDIYIITDYVDGITL